MMNQIDMTTMINKDNAESIFFDLMRKVASKNYADDHYRRAGKISRMRWQVIAKPLGSLGQLEIDISRMAELTGNYEVNIDKRALVIFCSDNGVIEEGVTQTGSDVTTAVANNIGSGRSCSHLMSEIAGVKVVPIDIGMKKDAESGDKNPLISIKIRRGTRNFVNEPAMTMEETYKAIIDGFWIVEGLREKGYNAIAVGEMGIGNTTTSAAITSALLGLDPAIVTGKGAGLPKGGLEHKIEVIRKGIENRKPDVSNPLDILHKLGGYDLAAMVGVFLGGTYYDIPIILDGVITLSAAALAYKLLPETRRCMFASHVTKEPAGNKLLEYLGLEAVVNAGLYLGEGTGAVTLFPLLDMALNVYKNMITFEQMDIEAYKPI